MQSTGNESISEPFVRTACFVVIVAGFITAWEGLVHSPVLDEPGHLAAGCLALRFGRYDLYEVNPPLVKIAAAVPVVLSQPAYDWSAYRPGGGRRTEWVVGQMFMIANGKRSFWLFPLARWSLLVFWIVGCVVIWRWANAVSGPQSACAAVCLWTLSPDVIAWTATVCPDSTAASIGVFAGWLLRRWLMLSNLKNALMAGAGLGLAILAKTSWLILLIVVPCALVWFPPATRWKKMIQFGLIATLAVFVVNCSYGFDKTLKRLGDFRFFSEALAGRKPDGSLYVRQAGESGNRFSGTWIGEIPVPLPASLLEGLDLQKYDFEEGKWSYFRGEHKMGGWWYWYSYALAVKTPLGTLLIFLATLAWFIRRLYRQPVHHWMCSPELADITQTTPKGSSAVTAAGRLAADGVRIETSQQELHENLILLAPAVCLFVLVSSQTGFSRYLRYVLPCYPFVFIWMSQIFSEKAGLPAWLRKVCWGLLAWSAISSLSVFPHSMSYFNELAGGPQNGPAHLIDANIDWGQDVLFLADWTKKHPTAKPLYLSLHVFFDPRVAGIDYQHPPVDPRYAENRQYLTSEQLGPQPGWYAVSVHQLYSRNKEFAYLFDFPRAGMVGYSIYIYHLTQRDVDDWNQKHRF
jgi:hypothetical protein